MINDEVLKHEIESISKQEGIYATDQFDALKILDRDLNSLGIKSATVKNLHFVDRVIYGKYLDLSEPIAFETKRVTEEYSLVYRLKQFLFRLENESTIRSVIFITYDACEIIDLEKINYSLKNFSTRFNIKIVGFEDYTNLKIPREFNKSLYADLLDEKFSKMDFSKLSKISPIINEAISKINDIEIQAHQKNFENLKNSKQITLCLGAGVSKSSGMPDWNELINHLWFQEIQGRIPFNDLSIEDFSKELTKIIGDSPLIRARTLAEISGYGLAEKIRDFIYSKQQKKSLLISSICDLISKTTNLSKLKIVNFNYDNLIEVELERIGISALPMFSERKQEEKFSIYHVHGYLPPVAEVVDKKHEEALVFNENSYHSQFYDYYSWSNMLLINAFCESNCIFIGCSMIDPNMRRLLEFSQKRIPGNRHFVFLRSENISENNYELKIAHNRIIKAQQNTLLELGVEVIWVKDHSEIPAKIDQLRDILIAK
jgi:SIR2-like domain